jgi:hypothetical protein
MFWCYFRAGFGPDAFANSAYVRFILLPDGLVAAAIAAIVAAQSGTKWWLLALLGPLCGAPVMRGAGQ